MGGRKWIRIVMFLFSLTILLGVQVDKKDRNSSGKAVQAAGSRKVGSLQELERALGSQADLDIVLKNNITVSRILWVRGRKTINGNGKYQIVRKTGANLYRGTLLYLRQGTLRLKQVTLNGGGSGSGVNTDINGKLVEVASGTVILDAGAKCCNNCNTSSFTDGGGGITVHSDGKAIMREKSELCNNLTITGGSGVRVEAGGSFVMEGGTIGRNAVVGQGADNDFDGRGGAIHNRGTVWIRGGTIYENHAIGYPEGGQNCSGYGGAIYNQNQLRITGGVIRNNEADFAGGAIYTNAAGRVSIEGGKLTGNCARNQRGGGIYVSAASQVLVRGGQIRENEARHGTQIFMSSTASGVLQIAGGTISGTGDAVWNQGGCVRISGGQITGSGCALRTMGNSEIRGGVLRGTRYGIYFGDGGVFLSGNFQVNRVYIKGEHKLTVDQKINAGSRCQICPETYREGKQLVVISSTEGEEFVSRFFSLKKKNRFLLEQGIRGLYIGRERYRIKFAPNGGIGEMKDQTVYVGEQTALSGCGFQREGYGFVGWSSVPQEKVKKSDIRFQDREKVYDLGRHGSTITIYALWVKRPFFSGQENGLSFYEGEFVTNKLLVYGMSATDECDGGITERIVVEKVILPDHSEQRFRKDLPTGPDHIGTGKIIFRVVNSFGVSATCQRSYEILPNHPPEIMVCDRYFFTADYSNSGRQEAEKDILDGLRMSDDVESEEQLQKNLELSWGMLDFEKAGEYTIRCRVKDQYGNRFYMNPGEQQRYGIGKQETKEFTVHVVDRENPERSGKKKGYVRFISPEYLDLLPDGSLWHQKVYYHALEETFSKTEDQYEETWVITGRDKKRIKKFLRDRENPFSKETNDLFIGRFSYLKQENACREGGVWK